MFVQTEAFTETEKYLHEQRVMVDEDGSVFLQPAFGSTHLLLIHLLTLVTDVPQTFTQFLYTCQTISIYSIFLFLLFSLSV